MGRLPSAKPTSFDIAYLAGVSQPTVSRALRGSKSVSAATRANVERIARELNYTVDKNASSLRSQRTHTLALLFFEDPTPDESMINPFFLSMLGSITRECALRGYDLLISFQQLHNDWHVAYQDSHRSDGIILLGYGDYQLYRTKLEHLVEMGTKFVRWGSVSDDSIGLTVGSDNIGAGEQAGAHLVEIGRKQIAFLGDASDHAPEFQDRYTGLCRAMSAAGIAADAALQRDTVSSEESGYAAARSLLASGARFDAIFAASDLIAIGAMRALTEAGLRLPQDIAIIGFDDIPAASLTSPTLTTVMQDLKGAGSLLVDALLSSIDDAPVARTVLPTRLIRRQSTAV
ncbi:MAG: LacI family DNA-binding transcriptional regulator [Sphingopyxis sp.]|jgi:DNA-binding LacI/PurR family transcriptional regulator|uniref:LacI family DNA-binding transcriptional regulator n=1 Tax=Sphingopyxis sp. TaxID=1908224 RepID=UPI001A368D28|nr:LacI family DNA-binding transcriptional regulator [Sphingopyxis sp.]MBL9065324.1 LacI family DNA-binding transcriptional regulator [Sphingopyxis sp.]